MLTLKIYIKFIIMAITALALTVGIHALSSQKQLSIIFNNVSIYTTQNVLIVAIILSWIASCKIFDIIRNIYHILMNFRTSCSNLYGTILNIIGIRKSEDDNALHTIRILKKKRMYRRMMYITQKNYCNGSKFLYLHLFVLLKLGKRYAFFHTIQKYQTGKAIPLFLFYLRSMPSWRQEMIIKSLAKANPNNSFFGYILAMNLYKQNKILESYRVLKDFFENKSIFLNDSYCIYLMSLIAVKIEQKESDNPIFTQKYLENIHNYRHVI